MTTLELAEKIAVAVIATDRYGGCDEDVAQAVLRCLREHDSWFCRVKFAEDEQGRFVIGSTAYEQVQWELFK